MRPIEPPMAICMRCGVETHAPWQQLPHERGSSYQWFRAFRDLGPGRSLPKTALALGRLVDSPPTLKALERSSARHDWQARARAWDDFADAQQLERDGRERALLRGRQTDEQLRLGAAFTRLAAERVGAGLTADQRRDDFRVLAAEELSALDAARFAKVGVEIQRLAAGQSTQNVQFSGALDFVNRLLGVALRRLPESQHEAFLAEVQAEAGLGAGS